MKKLLAALVVITVLFAIIPLSHYASAAQTVGGLITTDTVWSQGNFYKLSGPVGITQGVTLTIEECVNVDLASYYIQVNGTLKVQGTNNRNVFFNGSTYNYQSTSYTQNSIQFGDSSTDWNDQTTSGSIVQNAMFKSVALIISSSSPKITHNTFNGTGITSNSGSPSITYNAIYLAGISARGSAIISNNYFKGTGYQNAVDAGGNVNLSDNVIDGFWEGVKLSGNAVFKGNTVTYCYNVAVSSTSDAVIISENYVKYNTRSAGISGSGTIESNTITENKIGIETGKATVRNNNIYSNTENNFVLTGSANIDVSNNYWGTTNSESIEQKIRDSKDDFNLGTVTYTPFMSMASLSAPSAPLITIGTPTPAPTTWRPENTDSVTQTPQPTIYSDWMASIGSYSKGANTQLQIYIIQFAQYILAGVAIGWALVIGVVIRKRSKNRRKNAKTQ